MFRTSICKTFWPEIPLSSGRANLRRHIHYIRKALPRVEGMDWLEVTHSSVRWNTESPYWLDVEALLETLKDASTMNHAIELYRGDLVANLDFPYFEKERAAIRAGYLLALRGFAQSAKDEGHPEKSAFFLQRMLDADPWNEEVLCDLLAAKAKTGRRIEAIAHFQAFTARLAAEFAIEPSPETIAAVRALLKA